MGCRDRGHHILLKQIGRAVARQWLALSIHKDKCPWRAVAYGRQAQKCLSSIAPQRAEPILFALAVEANLPGWCQMKVCTTNGQGLADACARIIKKQQ